MTMGMPMLVLHLGMMLGLPPFVVLLLGIVAVGLMLKRWSSGPRAIPSGVFLLVLFPLAFLLLFAPLGRRSLAPRAVATSYSSGSSRGTRCACSSTPTRRTASDASWLARLSLCPKQWGRRA